MTTASTGYWEIDSRTDVFKLLYLKNYAVYFVEDCTISIKTNSRV